jgi:uncharacterized Zn ribbon protein
MTPGTRLVCRNPTHTADAEPIHHAHRTTCVSAAAGFNLRDGDDLGLIANMEIQHNVHHLVNHRVELVLRDIDAIEATGEIRILIAAQKVDLADL